VTYTQKSETGLYLSRWNRGNEAALEQLLDRHLAWITNHGRRRVGPFLRGKAETADYVQDAVIEFLRYGPRIQISDDRHFRALLVKIVENTLRDRRDWFMAQRRWNSKLRPLPSDTVLSLDPPKHAVQRPSQEAVKHEREAWIRLGMELVDPEDRDIIVLHQWEGRTFADIARRLKITSDAARMRYTRAVMRLGRKVAHLQRGDLTKAVG
jgi:RNA polymerase sigma factor (sigma-70 family)